MGERKTGPRSGGTPAAAGGRPRRGGNAASNGHWLRDDVGPVRYVPPLSGRNADADAAVIDELERRYAAAIGPAARHIRIEIEDGALILSGKATEDVARLAKYWAEWTGRWVCNRIAPL